MPSGPGSTDANGVYHLGEADNADGTFSGLLHLVTGAISTVIGSILGRLTALETGAKVVPASVSASTGTAVIGANGVITCTGVATLIVVTAFPTKFDDFMLRVKTASKSAGGDLLMLLRSGSTDLASGYTNIRNYRTGPSTNVVDASLPTTSFQIDVATQATRSFAVVEIANPNVAKAKSFLARMSGGNAAYISDAAADNASTAQWPDLKLTIDGTKTFTGTVQILGIPK